MNERNDPSKNNVEEKVVLPWEAELEVKDLIKPITVRRIRIVQTIGVLFFVIVSIVVGWYFLFAPPSGDTMVKEMIKASGGMEQWQSLQDGNFVRTHRLYDENGKVVNQSEETFYFMNNETGHQLLIKSRTNNGDEVVVGKDKGGFWAMINNSEVNPVTIAKDLEFMCEGDGCSPLCSSEMALYRMSFPFKLADQGVIPKYAGTATLNGNEVQLLDVTFDPTVGHDRWVFFVDPTTKYIRKIEHYASVKDNVQPEEIYLSDFKQEGPLVISHSNKYYRSNGKILEEYLITDVKFNASLTADFFNRPQQLSLR
jgi:hypothetical protein